MGFFTNSTPRSRARKEPVLSIESRVSGRYSDGWGAVSVGLGATQTAHGPVPAWLSESLSAVTACLEITTASIASLPASIVADAEDGRQAAQDTLPAVKLISRPNMRQSWPSFCMQVVADLQMQGNSVSWIKKDARGAVVSLTPIPWTWLSPQVVGVGAHSRLVFDLVTSTPETQLLGLPPRLLDTEVLHIKARSDNGLIGRSVLARAAGVVRESLEMSKVAEKTWRNGMRPSGYLSSPSYLTDEQRKLAKASLLDYSGALNAGKVPLLEGGWSFKQASLNSADAEFLSSRQFGVAEICRLFRVPEPLIQLGDRLPADLSPYLAAFAQLTLAPIVSAIEAEFDQTVLPAGYHLLIDMGGLLRGNYSAVAAANCAQVQSGIMTANEARSAVGLSSHADGDALRTGSAPNWPADAPGMPSLAPKPGHTGDGLPAPGTHQNEGASA